MFVYCFFHFAFVSAYCYAIVEVVAASSSWVFGFGFWLSLFATRVAVVLLPFAPTLGFYNYS